MSLLKQEPKSFLELRKLSKAKYSPMLSKKNFLTSKKKKQKITTRHYLPKTTQTGVNILKVLISKSRSTVSTSLETMCTWISKRPRIILNTRLNNPAISLMKS